jgi:bacterioferritin-associated ferredoxin
MSEQQTKEQEFLRGLAELSRRTGIIIGGCGCCDSPFLEVMTEEEAHPDAGYALIDEVRWVHPGEEYNWERHSKGIVK